MSVKVCWALLRSEMSKVWAKPILELTVAFMAVMAIFMVQPFTEIVDHSKFSIFFQSALTGSISHIVSSLMLSLVVMCGVLMALSFAKDYESGLMQSILSVPVSRKMFFVAKFFAVVLPLALLSWVLTTFFVGLTFYSSPWLVLQLSFYVLPITFLSLMFCGGIGVLVALLVKRSIPAVLTSLLANFFFWFLTTIDTSPSGGASYANYLCLTPYKGALVFLNKLLGIVPKGISMTDTLEVTLSTGTFGVLLIFYACILVIPLFVYFSRRFEICE